MKTIITASLFLATASLTACATDDAQGDEMDISITSRGGKSDAIDGKQLRARTGEQLSPWYNYEDAALEQLSNLTKVKTVKIDVATNDTVVVSGNVFLFPGSKASTSIEESPWFGDKILNLSVDGAPGGKTAGALGFVMVDAMVESGEMIRCKRGALDINFFQSVAIDLGSQQVYVDDTHTFTFTECGIAPEGTPLPDGASAGTRTWMFGTFVVPLETTGSLKGTYNYKMKAELI